MRRKISFLALMIIFVLFIICSMKSNEPNSDKVADNEIQDGQNNEGIDGNTTGNSQDINNSKEDISDNTQEGKKITTMPVNFFNASLSYWYHEYAEHTESYLHIPGADMIERYWKHYTQLVSCYDVGEENEELFAFVFYLGDYEGEQPEDYPVQQKGESQEDYLVREEEYLKKKTMELIEWMGLPILENYPYSYDILRYCGKYAVYSPKLEAYLPPECEGAPVVVGTIKQIKELCESGEPINGWYCRFVSATRPDIAEYMNRIGYKQQVTASGFYVSGWDGMGFGRYYMSSEIMGTDPDWQVLLDVNVIEPK